MSTFGGGVETPSLSILPVHVQGRAECGFRLFFFKGQGQVSPAEFSAKGIVPTSAARAEFDDWAYETVWVVARGTH